MNTWELKKNHFEINTQTQNSLTKLSFEFESKPIMENIKKFKHTK
jgi:hypothetical protein